MREVGVGSPVDAGYDVCSGIWGPQARDPWRFQVYLGPCFAERSSVLWMLLVLIKSLWLYSPKARWKAPGQDAFFGALGWALHHRHYENAWTSIFLNVFHTQQRTLWGWGPCPPSICVPLATAWFLAYRKWPKDIWLNEYTRGKNGFQISFSELMSRSVNEMIRICWSLSCQDFLKSSKRHYWKIISSSKCIFHVYSSGWVCVNTVGV